jgi:5-methylcytosine-specific restriction endonuclease McrA
MDTPAEKECSTCHFPKPLDQFAIDKSKKDGRHTICKDCKSVYDKAYREVPENKAKAQQYKLDNRKHCTDLENERRKRDPEKFRAKARERYAANPEQFKAWNRKSVKKNWPKVKARQKRWRMKNRDRLLKKNRDKYAANIIKFRQYFRAYYAKNRKKLRAYMRRYEAKYPERVKAWRDKWDALNPDKRRDTTQRHRARLKNASTIVHVDRVAIIARDRSICHICRKKVSREDMSLDHLIPLACGGPHIPENLAVAHRRCNSRRGVGRMIPAQLRLLP